MVFHDAPVKLIPLNAIHSDDYFKISRPLPKDLVGSVMRCGIIEPVILCNQDVRYKIIYGHNRIKAAQNAGIQEVPAKVITKFNLDDFLKIIRVKLYHNALGTIGKIKSLYLLYDYFHVDKKQVVEIARELSLPASLIELKNIQLIINMPPVIIDYIDARAVAPKFVVPLLRLSPTSITILEQIVASCQIRVNYFNSIIVMIEDIYRNGKDKVLLEVLGSLLVNERVTDEDVYNCIYSIRYPEYTKDMTVIDNVKKKLNAFGIKVEIPAYLEGDSIHVIFEVKKNNPIHGLLQKDHEVAGLIQSIVDLL
ncbi:MAG: ParB/RepB/Spo0J family partition protein [Spirochaetes bacterium]|nr:ParB/RepB/Spo0J family partition protein [Spirochaetota bacterium]